MTRSKTWPAPTIDPPEDLNEYLQDVLMDVEHAEASDGCTVEPDGICPHGHPSWEVRYGLI